VSRTIELDDDVYDHLLDHIQEIGEPASAVLRRLLGINGPGTPSAPTDFGPRDQRLLDFLESAEFRHRWNTTERYLTVLSFLYREDSEQFGQLPKEVTGTSRRYFAESREEIARSGDSTNPQRIPDSPYWALTNSPSRQKQDTLRRVLRVLKYDPEAAKQVLKSIRRR
jgi:negative modulator of initiation of replication